MSTLITLALRDEVFQQAEQLAQVTSCKVAELLADAIELSLAPITVPATNRPVAELTDAEVSALSILQLPPAQDRRLSRLLDRQQAGKLTAQERGELLALMQVYQQGLLRKAQALREAVRRGLREQLAP
jgi:hypothetical protein